MEEDTLDYASQSSHWTANPQSQDNPYAIDSPTAIKIKIYDM